MIIFLVQIKFVEYRNIDACDDLWICMLFRMFPAHPGMQYFVNMEFRYFISDFIIFLTRKPLLLHKSVLYF